MAASGNFQGAGQAGGRKGRIQQWDDAKGYGWTEVDGGRVFVHVKDFVSGQRRPGNGDEIRFTLESDAQGRPRAGKIELVKSGVRIGPVAWGLWCLLLVLPGVAILYLPGPEWLAPGMAAAASAITWALYAHDKKQATAGGWRVSEKALHVGELLGGWPGAFLAQRHLRHKCSKLSYLFVFWLIVLLHQYVALDLILDFSLSRLVWRKVVNIER